ncbi:2-5A-dependent ribonuclease-like [Microplitis mediator]|uniref:2-5A-dependent ribonuclease-like n=1 Tax=Microplitis mediator TaxID=375433 RepID=UPI002554F9BF|nr:2-5A-dependent ribonuclease-like [Microplitis mediator]XP_057319961.1 2-5A-dependent ribonuclease-like [Microplitis mediator]
MFNDDERLVDYLLRKGADMHLKSECWCTVFTAAVLVNKLPILQSLISFGADVNHQIDFCEFSRFRRATIQYYKEILRWLFMKPNIDLDEMFKFTTSATLPLYIAIEGSNVEMVELLLKNNTDPNPDAGFYGPPLIHAAVRRSLPIIKLLLAYGSNANSVRIPYGESPLHLVVKNEDSEAVRTFLNHDMIDINIVSDYKNSALHYAIIYTTNINIIKQLLNAGIDVNLINHLGKTAFTTARLANVLDNVSSDPKKVTDTITEHIVKSLSLKYVSDSTILRFDVESIFPLYGGIMTYRLKKALRRKELLFNAMDLTNDILQELKLPNDYI